jgi:hypothetical protein
MLGLECALILLFIDGYLTAISIFLEFPIIRLPMPFVAWAQLMLAYII